MRSHCVFFALFAMGCSNGDSGRDASADGTAPPMDATASDDGEAGGLADTGPPCTGLAIGPCRACCTSTFAAGAKVAEKAGVTCACQAQYCQSQCASTLCDGGAAAGACDSCYGTVIGVAGDGGCYDEILNACAADKGCQAYQACFSACK
jgi:hypothetical protein